MSRCEDFLREIVTDGDWEYGDGSPMSPDAAEFLAEIADLKRAVLCSCQPGCSHDRCSDCSLNDIDHYWSIRSKLEDEGEM